MAHLEVKVDGVLKYEGDVPDSYLPRQPEMLPTALGAPGTATPGAPVPPLARVFLLGVVGPMLAQWLERSPQLQPISAECEMDAASGGFTIRVSGPAINVDELKP